MLHQQMLRIRIARVVREISGTLSASVTNAFDACTGGTITIDYAGTDACGNALTAQHIITVTPPSAQP